MINAQACNICGLVKPLSEFYGNSRSNTGHATTCKDCIKQRSKQWRIDNREQYRAYNAAWDKEHREQMLAIKRKCAKKRYHKDIVKSREYVRIQSLRFYYNHRAKRLAYSKQYRQTLDKERRNAYIKTWRQVSPKARAGMRINTHKRHAKQRALPSTFTYADWHRALDYFGNTCAVCGRQQGLWHTLAQDHWIPVSKNGGYTPDNIVPLCHGVDGCNNSKNSKHPEQWLVEKFGKRKAKQILARIEQYFAWVAEQNTNHD